MMIPSRPLLLLLAGLLMWQTASAQSNDWGLPPSPNGTLAAALLDAINADDAAVHQQFVETHYTPAFADKWPMERHLKQFSQLHENLAGAEVNGLDMMMGAQALLTLVMRGEDGAYTHLKLTLEQSTPPRLAGLEAEAAEAPPTHRMISALMETINAADPEVHQAFVEAYFSPAFKEELPMETHLNLFQQLHQDLAGADVANAEAMSQGGSDETVMLTLAAKDGKRFVLTFDVQMTSPPRLITLSVQPE